MRRYGTLSEVAHAWAHQLSEGPFSTSNGSFYWRGDTIYSYGFHFPIATFRTDLNGYDIVMNGRYYSATTSKHVSVVRSAISHLRVFHLDKSMDSYPNDTLETLARKAYSVYEEIYSELPSKRVGAGPYIDLLERWTKLRIINKKIPEIPSDLEEKLTEARRKHAENEKARRAARREQEIEDIAKWRAGEIRNLNRAKFQYLKRVDDEVHTSIGVRFPVDHAIVAWKRLKQYYESGRELPTIRFGYFKLDRIKPNGDLVAGCHTIPKTEVFRFAEELGLEPVQC